MVYGCFYLNRLNFAPVIPLIMEDLKLSHTQVGLISTFFFSFHAAAQFPAGYLSDIFGPKKIITIGGVISALANFFFSAGSSLFYLTGFQSLNGLGQGGGFGPSVKLVSNWFPETERGRALGIHATSISFFTIIAYALAGYLGKMFGWRAPFWIFPIILLSVLFIYRVVVADHPDGNSVQSFPTRPPETAEKSPGNRNRLIAILSNRDIRMACLGFFCLLYINYGILIWLPAYLYETYGLSVVKASLLAGLYPMAGLVAGPLGGYLSDMAFSGRRKPLLLIGLSSILLSTIFLASADRLEWAMILIASVGFFVQIMAPLFMALELDLLPPKLSGTGAGFLQTGGQLGSMCAIFFSGLLVDVFGSYNPVFLVLGIFAAAGIAAILFVCESKPC
ncbi:MAG: MFS transporter [Desulfobacterales bacterium]|nr:MFS transporter [Desulfobacterales bacterium]